jgi:hypothetical protein
MQGRLSFQKGGEGVKRVGIGPCPVGASWKGFSSIDYAMAPLPGTEGWAQRSLGWVLDLQGQLALARRIAIPSESGSKSKE